MLHWQAGITDLVQDFTGSALNEERNYSFPGACEACVQALYVPLRSVNFRTIRHRDQSVSPSHEGGPEDNFAE